MKLTIATIHDTVSEAWINPMYFQSEAQAIRTFVDLLEDDKAEFSRHPEHYALYKVGVFNQRDGIVEGCVPELLILGANCVKGNN